MSEPSVEPRIQIDQNRRVFAYEPLSFEGLYPSINIDLDNPTQHTQQQVRDFLEVITQAHDHAQERPDRSDRVHRDTSIQFLSHIYSGYGAQERTDRSYRSPYQYNSARQVNVDYLTNTEFFDSANVDNYFTNIKSLDEYFIEDCTNIQELKEDIDYSCSICFGIFDNPHKLSCNHTFCKKCIEKINNSMCPLCRKSFLWFISSVYNKELATEIEKIQIKCIKCNKNHLIKENCDTKKICNKCDLHIDKNKLVQHLCNCGIITTCVYCSRNVFAESYLLHTETCDKRIEICGNCHESVKYNVFHLHTCPSKIKCKSCHGIYPFDKHALHEIKCEQKMTKKNKKQEWNRRK